MLKKVWWKLVHGFWCKCYSLFDSDIIFKVSQHLTSWRQYKSGTIFMAHHIYILNLLLESSAVTIRFLSMFSMYKKHFVCLFVHQNSGTGRVIASKFQGSSRASREWFWHKKLCLCQQRDYYKYPASSVTEEQRLRAEWHHQHICYMLITQYKHHTHDNQGQTF